MTGQSLRTQAYSSCSSYWTLAEDSTVTPSTTLLLCNFFDYFHCFSWTLANMGKQGQLTLEENETIRGKLHDDNGHVHRANVVQPWAKLTRLSLLNGHPQSPDLNPTTTFIWDSRNEGMLNPGMTLDIVDWGDVPFLFDFDCSLHGWSSSRRLSAVNLVKGICHEILEQPYWKEATKHFYWSWTLEVIVNNLQPAVIVNFWPVAVHVWFDKCTRQYFSYNWCWR